MFLFAIIVAVIFGICVGIVISRHTDDDFDDRLGL